MELGRALLSRGGGVARTEHAAIWYRPPGLWTTRFWGRPGEEDARLAVATWDLALRSDADPTFVSLVDASRLAGIDAAAFAILAEYMSARRDSFHARMTKQALVRPDGIAGSVVSGTLAMLDYRMPISVFTEIEPALEWLVGEGAASLAREVDERLGAGDPKSALIAALRERLSRDPDAVEARDVARMLGMSLRSLQRRLSESGTSFHEELNAARVRYAQELLAQSDDKIASIARRVGFASAPYFARVFRAATRESPEEWRRRHRG